MKISAGQCLTAFVGFERVLTQMIVWFYLNTLAQLAEVVITSTGPVWGRLYRQDSGLTWSMNKELYKNELLSRNLYRKTLYQWKK